MNFQSELSQTSVGSTGHLLQNKPSLLLKTSVDMERLNAVLVTIIKS